MAVTRTLRLIFGTAGGGRAVVSVRDPKQDLTAAQVEAAMNTIIAKNVFTSMTGDLTSILGAEVVERSVTELVSA